MLRGGVNRKKKKENAPRGGVRKGKKKKTKVGRGPFEQCVGDFCSAPHRHVSPFYFVFLFSLFSFGSLWSRGWENDPTSVLLIRMPLRPITRATVVFFSELGFADSASGTSF